MTKILIIGVLAADIRLARTNPLLASIDSSGFPRRCFELLVLAAGLSSTDQRTTKLSRGKHCPLCKTRGPRWETCGVEGAVVSWFFDDINSLMVAARNVGRSLRFCFLLTFHPSRGTSAKATMSCHGGLNEPSDRDGNRARLLPRIGGMRCRGDARARARAEPLCKSSIRRSVEELAQMQPYHHRVNQSIRLSSIQCFSLAENRIFFESYVDVDGDDGTGSGW